jgi:pyruvate/2-oxoglutarate/acetoin dehydrogenase E1 component
MPQKSIRQALKEAIAQEMRRDPRIIVVISETCPPGHQRGGRTYTRMICA